MANDPYRAFNFGVMLDGGMTAGFVECAGLGAEVDVIPYREAGVRQMVRHLPGQTRFTPMVLRYGVTHSTAMWDWFQTTIDAQPERRDISVVQFQDDGVTEAFRFNLMNAWVSSWRAAKLDARTSEIAIDTMTVVYDRMERD